MNQDSTQGVRLPPPRTRVLLPTLLRYAGVLLLGVIIGASVTILLGRGIVRYWANTPDQWPERAARRATAVLALDDRERAAMKQVFADRFEAMQEIRRQFHPRLNAEFDRLEAQGGEQLPPAKAAKWKAFIGRMRSNYFLLGPPPPQTHAPAENKE